MPINKLSRILAGELELLDSQWGQPSRKIRRRLLAGFAGSAGAGGSGGVGGSGTAKFPTPVQDIISITGAYTVKPSDAGSILLLSTNAGVNIDLPNATGTANVFEFYFLFTILSGSLVIRAGRAGDFYYGSAIISQTDGTIKGFATPASINRLTMDGSTRGGFCGDWIRFRDISPTVWAVEALLNTSGGAVTPWSAV